MSFHCFHSPAFCASFQIASSNVHSFPILKQPIHDHSGLIHAWKPPTFGYHWGCFKQPWDLSKEHRSASPADWWPPSASPHDVGPGSTSAGTATVPRDTPGTLGTPACFVGQIHYFFRTIEAIGQNRSWKLRLVPCFSCWIFVEAGWIMLNPYLRIEHIFFSWLIVGCKKKSCSMFHQVPHVYIYIHYTYVLLIIV